jgi:peptidoglycan-associated lipoprotein
MRMNRTAGIICLAAALALGTSACKKKTPIVAPTAPIGPDKSDLVDPNAGKMKPTILSFSVEPSSIERGQSATLRWSVSNANAVSIDNGIGEVQGAGTRRITPAESTTYRLTAAGPNGTISGTTTVNVTGAAPTNTGLANAGTFDQIVNSQLSDALFDYDGNTIRADAQQALNKDADVLKKIFADFPNRSVIVEGHCDERGSAEYNLGLGDQRASSAKAYLVQLGVNADRLKTVSYGKERPQCTEANDDCYQRNRRAHFSAAQ